jgi:DNA invertase Pin-like site-specific DNA recombinase
MDKRAAIYVRVSTDKQTIENQLHGLRQIAERRAWEVVHEYNDAGISGAKSREARPGLDEMLKDAQRRRFDVVMAWAIDRLGRSLIDLLGTIQTLEVCAVDADWKADVSDYGRLCRVRTQYDPPTGACRT